MDAPHRTDRWGYGPGSSTGGVAFAPAGYPDGRRAIAEGVRSGKAHGDNGVVSRAPAAGLRFCSGLGCAQTASLTWEKQPVPLANRSQPPPSGSHGRRSGNSALWAGSRTTLRDEKEGCGR